jgi:hypothetical protein
MTTSPTPSNEEQIAQPRDAAYWAGQGSTFKVTNVPSGALNLNVEGRMALSPLQGFGQMWQKTFRVRLKGADVQPTEVIKQWKENFPKFWPRGNRFYVPLTGIAPGEVAVINMLIPGTLPVGLPLSTGVLVLYADDESFTLMTPQGHTFAGWITFSSYKEDDCTVAQAQVLLRSYDPIYEIAFRFGASNAEDSFWKRTLASLAAHFGVDAPVEAQKILVDPKVQWSEAKNVWHNSAIRTVLYKVTLPVRRVGRLFRATPEKKH